ncbi:MAG: hypothetical protein U1F70_05415 [Candidatus Competibacteraceae bacterium]
MPLLDPLCLLFLQDPEIINPNPSTINALPAEGRLEYHVGSRIITGRPGNNTLLVNTPFNQVSQNVGANVWYTVGCSPHKGTIRNFDNTEAVVLTDESGVASTIMSYPASQVGRRFMVAAESDGSKVGAVMTHWYLGTPDGSILTITQPASLAAQIVDTVGPNPLTVTPWPALVATTQTVDPGAAITLPVTLQVLDGGVLSGGALRRTPIPAVSIAMNIVINNPAEAAAQVAENKAAGLQAALDAFIAANPGVCDQVITDPTTDPPPLEIGIRPNATSRNSCKQIWIQPRLTLLQNVQSPTCIRPRRRLRRKRSPVGEVVMRGRS